MASRPNKLLAVDFTILEPDTTRRKNALVMTVVFSKYSLAVATKIKNCRNNSQGTCEGVVQ